ncbi:MAG: PAP2 superfamily protein [Candidatus Accumulibacter adjunctus]|uniref:PAP2 superfamily protein n=1 Tax=Candidatus Accumulibacter adjunctus TaxID=1454001 RepID=A0A011NQ36_9PROT|nr:MAG: PAP2 superfamily protein [Candidatus Accumulibacter adjunctus]
MTDPDSREVLAAFFPERAGELQEWAAEAAMSRLYGGIHFRSDNSEGLRLGRAVGRRVVERSLGGAGADSGGGRLRPAAQDAAQ